MAMPLRRGRHALLEDQADELIRKSLEGVKSHSAKSDILTAWKNRDRHAREVYAASGVVDPAIRRGMYHRVANPGRPDLNSRDGVTMARHGIDSLTTFMNDGSDE